MGALNLKGFTVLRTSDTGKLHSFRLERKDYKKTRLHIAANSAENADRWIAALSEATKYSVNIIACMALSQTYCNNLNFTFPIYIVEDCYFIFIYKI